MKRVVAPKGRINRTVPPKGQANGQDRSGVRPKRGTAGRMPAFGAVFGGVNPMSAIDSLHAVMRDYDQ